MQPSLPHSQPSKSAQRHSRYFCRFPPPATLPFSLPQFVRPQGAPPTWHSPLVTALPSAVQARSCPRSGFLGFQCRHPSGTPSHPHPRSGIRDILATFLLPLSSHVSPPCPPAGRTASCHSSLVTAPAGRSPPAICPPAGRAALRGRKNKSKKQWIIPPDLESILTRARPCGIVRA